VNGQIHSPGTLLPGYEQSVPMEYEAGRASDQVWTFWRREKSVPEENEGRFCCRPAWSLDTRLY